MKRRLLEKLILVSVFLIFYILIEIITFSWLNLSFLPENYIIDIVVAFLFASVSFIFKSHRISKIYLSLVLFLVLIVSLVNQTLSIELNGEVFSIYHILLAQEVTNVFSADYLHWPVIVIEMSIMITFLIVIHLVSKAFFKAFDTSQGYRWKILPMYIGFLLVFLTVLNFTQTFNHYTHLENISIFRRTALREYGMMGFYYKEIDLILFDGDTRDISLSDLEEALILKTPSMYSEDHLDIEYSGLLEGKNVITIMIESGQSFAVNEVLTPHLYQMTKEGLYFPNHYSENSTKGSELIGMLGNFPFVRLDTKKYTYDFSHMFTESLKRSGYHTAYYHENNGTFYDRENVIPAIGFENVYFHEDLFPNEDIYGWSGDYTLDSRTMDRMLPSMFDDINQPFYYFWTSLVTHGPYNHYVTSKRGLNNIQKYTDLGYFDKIDSAESNGDWINLLTDSTDSQDPGRYRFYQAALMDFDVALGKLLDRLKSEGLIDDTVIILYGDHNLYYHQMNLRINDVEPGEIEKVDMYKTFFAIYNPKLTNAYLTNENTTSTTVDKFISPYDIIPTYYHLLGMPYYDNFLLGNSIFSKDESVFYSSKLTAFFNQNYFSFDDEEIYYPENTDLSQDIEAMNYIEITQELTDKIFWLDRWYSVSKRDQ